MDAEHSPPDEVLVRMLFDILSEAETVRWHDPIKAAHLDDAANDLRAVLAESDAEGRPVMPDPTRKPECAPTPIRTGVVCPECLQPVGRIETATPRGGFIFRCGACGHRWTAECPEGEKT
jgi:hypothetical protein